VNYESQHGALPPSNELPLSGPNRNKVAIARTTNLSWLVRILPFAEQQALFDQFDFTRTAISQDVKLAPHSAQPTWMLCPSDEAAGRFYQSRFAGNRPLGKANYVAYASPEHAECMPIAKGALIHIAQPLSHVEDGTSKTIMLSEVRTRDHIQDPRGAWVLARVGSSIIAADMHGTNRSTRICNQNPPPSVYVPNPIWSRFALLPNSGVGPSIPRDDLVECVDSAEADLLGMPCWSRGDTSAAPRSLHVGGVNSARIDGSVQWITNEIEPIILGAMVCVNDGLTLDVQP
jgi:hypothetical protein